jgi:hypothetical protein
MPITTALRKLPVTVHLAGLSSNVSLIGFHFAHELAINGALLQCEADTVHHELGGLLSDSKIAMNFI